MLRPSAGELPRTASSDPRFRLRRPVRPDGYARQRLQRAAHSILEITIADLLRRSQWRNGRRMAHCPLALRRAPAPLWLALAWVLPTSAPAFAQPSVRVRAGTQIELEAVPSERGLMLQGALLDDLGQALAGRAIELHARGRSRRQAATHAPDRRRRLLPRAVRAAAGPLSRVRAFRRRRRVHRPAKQRRELDAGKADVRLRFIEPRTFRLELEAPAHAVAVRASSSAGAAGLELACMTSAATSSRTRGPAKTASCVSKCRAARSVRPDSAS